MFFVVLMKLDLKLKLKTRSSFIKVVYRIYKSRIASKFNMIFHCYFLLDELIIAYIYTLIKVGS